jgi:hypothetical protein
LGKIILPSLVCLVLGSIPFALADEGVVPPLSVSRPFPSHGTVRMRLMSGDYSIRAASTDEIHVTGTAQNPSDSGRLKAEIRIQGTEATVVTDGPDNDAHFTIEVPRHSNLLIRLTAGDISITRIEGDLDVSSYAGDVNVEVSRASDYRLVDASVYAGDLNAPAFGTSKGGLFRSFRWTGSGTYKLHVHLGAGDLNLTQGE